MVSLKTKFFLDIWNTGKFRSGAIQREGYSDKNVQANDLCEMCISEREDSYQHCGVLQPQLVVCHLSEGCFEKLVNVEEEGCSAKAVIPGPVGFLKSAATDAEDECLLTAVTPGDTAHYTRETSGEACVFQAVTSREACPVTTVASGKGCLLRPAPSGEACPLTTGATGEACPLTTVANSQGCLLRPASSGEACPLTTGTTGEACPLTTGATGEACPLTTGTTREACPLTTVASSHGCLLRPVPSGEAGLLRAVTAEEGRLVQIASPEAKRTELPGTPVVEAVTGCCSGLSRASAREAVTGTPLVTAVAGSSGVSTVPPVNTAGPPAAEEPKVNNCPKTLIQIL
jgi:hypothetical protein